MTTRGDFLELIDRAPGPLRTIQGHWQSWAHVERAEAAQLRAHGQIQLHLSAGQHGPAHMTMEGTREIWLELPDRWRVVSSGPPLYFSTLELTDGRTVWAGSDEQLLASDRANPHLKCDSPLHEQLFPGPMLGWTQFDDPAAGEFEGRSVWVVRAHMRDSAEHFPAAPPDMQLLPGAEHVYTIDARTGIVLWHEATVDDELCLQAGLTEIKVDEPLDPALFSPPDQATVTYAIDQHLATLDENGVDTSALDRTDAGAVFEAYMEWMQSRHGRPVQPRIEGHPDDD